jgi:site-specific recombinase XerD
MDLFDRFLQERTYLKNVSPETLRYYRWVRRAFQPILANPTKFGMMDRIQTLLADGVSPTSVNTYLRGLKAYCRWLQAEGYLQEPLIVQPLKTQSKVIATLTPEQIRTLIAFKPKGINQTRTHTAALLILDGGYRISELLTLPFEHCDFENLVVKVRGKGGKHRLVPLSVEMRKVLYRYAVKLSGPGRLMFGTRNGTSVTVRNFERDLKGIGKRVGIEGVRFSPHTLRHSFAVSYLRNGGNLYYLSRLLGHASVKTTGVYLQSVGVDELAAVHDRLSPLAPEPSEGGKGGDCRPLAATIYMHSRTSPCWLASRERAERG